MTTYEEFSRHCHNSRVQASSDSVLFVSRHCHNSKVLQHVVVWRDGRKCTLVNCLKIYSAVFSLHERRWLFESLSCQLVVEHFLNFGVQVDGDTIWNEVHSANAARTVSVDAFHVHPCLLNLRSSTEMAELAIFDWPEQEWWISNSSPYLTLPYLTLPYLTLPYLTLPYLTLPYLTLPYLTLPYLTLPYLTLPYLTLPYLTLPNLTLPYLTSHSIKNLAFHSWLRWKMIILPITSLLLLRSLRGSSSYFL